MECPRDLSLDPKATHHMCHPSSAIARASGISIHMYADDTQLYVSFRPEDFPAAQAKNGAMYSANRAVVIPELSQIKRWKN